MSGPWMLQYWLRKFLVALVLGKTSIMLEEGSVLLEFVSFEH